MSPEPASGPGALTARILTVAILLPLLLGLLWTRSLIGVAGVFAVVLGLGALEWASLAGWRFGGRLLFVVAVIGLGGIAILARPDVTTQQVFFALATAGWGAAIARTIGAARGHIALTATGLTHPLVGLAVLVPGYLGLLALMQDAPERLLILLLMVWTADTLAYFAGRRWGKRLLAPRISPGKTWAGAWGGLAGVVLLALGLSLWRPDSVMPTLPQALACGVLIAIVAIFGDLFESLLKRGCGAKDSGRLLPGHGGILDRVDSLLAAAPVYALLNLLTTET